MISIYSENFHYSLNCLLQGINITYLKTDTNDLAQN